MSTIKLSKRLQAITSKIPFTGALADVGTDHGYLPVWLLQSGFAGRVFASDIGSGPLESARRSAEAQGLSEKIIFLHCDGLSGFEADSVSTVVIAGMGGETIAAILEAAPWTRDKLLILQPMTKSDRLRAWLFESGYIVESEDLVDDGAIYEILTATGGADSPYLPGETLTGHFSLISSHPLFPARLAELIERKRHALEGLARAARAEDTAHVAGLKEELDGLLNIQQSLHNIGG